MSRLAPLLLILAACDDYVLDTGGDATDRVSTILALTGDPVAGEASFGICDDCHLDGGTKQGLGPVLADRVPSLTDEALVRTMVEGWQGMPPANVTDQESADILAWLRQEFGGP